MKCRLAAFSDRQIHLPDFAEPPLARLCGLPVIDDEIPNKEHLMNLTREDLMAAASAGIIPYKQVDTMLVFLRHREAVHVREAQQEEQKGMQTAQRAGQRILMVVLTLLGIGAAAMLAAINMGLVPNTQFSIEALTVRNLQWFIALYALFTLIVVAWTERRRISGTVRVVITALLALAPLAVFASQQLHVL
jgi:hypothetical protein